MSRLIKNQKSLPGLILVLSPEDCRGLLYPTLRQLSYTTKQYEIYTEVCKTGNALPRHKKSLDYFTKEVARLSVLADHLKTVMKFEATKGGMNALEYSSKIQAIINRDLPDDAPDLPEMAPVLAMFLKDFRPCDVVSRESMQFSSIDIVRILEESCALSVTDVAKVMIYLGYHLKVDETFDCEWLLSVKESEPEI